MKNYPEEARKILMSLDLGYKYRMSDYAYSREQEKEYEREGLEEVDQALSQLCELVVESMGEDDREVYEPEDGTDEWSPPRNELRDELRSKWTLKEKEDD